MNLEKKYNIIYVIILYSKTENKKTIMISDVTILDSCGTSQNGGRICRYDDCAGLCAAKSCRHLTFI